jgi:hypothetical protein
MRSNRVTCSLDEALAGASSAVDAVVRSGSGDDLHGAAHDDLSAALARIRCLQARLDFVALSVIGEVDRRGSHVEDGALTTAAWARMHTRRGPREAAASVRTARVLRSGELPLTTAAFRAGEVDSTQVGVIADGVADAPAGSAALIEPVALDAARRSEPREVANVMAMFRDALDPDASDQAAVARYHRRGLSAATTLDGMVAGSFLADEVSGSVILTALDAAAPLVTGERRTSAQRRLDALADICRRFLASADAPMTGGGHAHVIVTVDSDTLAGDPRSAGSPGGTLSWVGRVGASTARRVACDGDVTVVEVGPGGAGRVVDRQQRFFTWAQRKAMIARDGDRCAVPYCDRPVSWSDGHHLLGWQHGGPTTVENGALPCAAHHTLLHEGGWTLQRRQDGRYLLRHRDGKVIGPDPGTVGHSRPPPTRRE